MAAAEVNPLMTGKGMKSTKKPAQGEQLDKMITLSNSFESAVGYSICTRVRDIDYIKLVHNESS